MVHVVRIYYTLFDEALHNKIVDMIKESTHSEVIVKSSWVPEFRHLELRVTNEEECVLIRKKIEEILERELEGEYYKIDHVLV